MPPWHLLDTIHGQELPLLMIGGWDGLQFVWDWSSHYGVVDWGHIDYQKGGDAADGLASFTQLEH